MQIEGSKVMTEVATGISFVCAMCTKYWEGKSLRANGTTLNIVNDRQLCTATDGCGSPFAGDVFHEYVGPLVRFDQLCFVCGEQAKKAVKVKNLLRVIGVCDKHVEWFKAWKFEPKLKGQVITTTESEKREILGG